MAARAVGNKSATNWSARTDSQTAYRRASGRRHYNAFRTMRRLYRQMQVSALCCHGGLGYFDRGNQTIIAKLLGVSRSTICRDIKAIMELSWSELYKPVEARKRPKRGN